MSLTRLLEIEGFVHNKETLGGCTTQQKRMVDVQFLGQISVAIVWDRFQ